MSFTEALNAIDIAGWKENPKVAVEIGEAVETESWKRSPWESLVGKGIERAIRTFKRKNTTPFRPQLKTPLTGEGIVGNADLDTNYDNIEYLNQTIYPKVIANASRSKILEYEEMEQEDFIKEAAESHTDWVRRKRDKYFACALANDFTNAVVCDAVNGVKDISNFASIAEATKRIKKDDICNVKALRKAIFMARNGRTWNNKKSFAIRPTRANTISEDGITYQHYSYIILLDGFAAMQLKSDVEWIEMQKYAGLRGDANHLFDGLLGTIDGCLVVDMGVWNDTDAGMVNSEVSDTEFRNNLIVENHTLITPPSFYTGDNPICVGALIGAGALVMSGENTTRIIIDDTQDSGRKLVVGATKLMSIAKGRFDNLHHSGTAFAGQDFGCIGIFSSMKEM